MAFCKSCGTRLGSGQRKCPNCGRASKLGASLSGAQRPLTMADGDPDASGSGADAAAATAVAEEPSAAPPDTRAETGEITVDVPEDEVAEIGEPAEVDVTAAPGEADVTAAPGEADVTAAPAEVDVAAAPAAEIADIEVEDVTGDVPEVPAEETQPPRKAPAVETAPAPKPAATKAATAKPKAAPKESSMARDDDSPVSSKPASRAASVPFGAEAMRARIAERPDLVEDGLRLHRPEGVDVGEDGGLETDVGEIHLLAEDGEDALVVVRVAGRKDGDPVGPVLEQMGWVSKHLAGAKRPVRGVVLLEPPAPALGYAARAVAGSVRFKTWRVRVEVEDVEV